MTSNGDRFATFGKSGDLVMARLAPENYEEISRTTLLGPMGVGLGRSVVWSHSAYADKSACARNDQEIVCISRAAK